MCLKSNVFAELSNGFHNSGMYGDDSNPKNILLRSSCVFSEIRIKQLFPSFLLFPIITSRNLQPLFYKVFRPLSKKITHFLQKKLYKFKKICGEADWVYLISIDWRRFFCYLRILADMPPIRILSYPNFLIFTPIPLCFPKVHGIISCSSGTLIFPRLIPLCGTAIPFSGLNPDSLPVCFVPIFLP